MGLHRPRARGTAARRSPRWSVRDPPAGARRAPGWSRPPPAAGAGRPRRPGPAGSASRPGAAGRARSGPAGAPRLLVRGQVGPQQRHRGAPAVGDGRLQGEEPQETVPPVHRGEQRLSGGEGLLGLLGPPGPAGHDGVGVVQRRRGSPGGAPTAGWPPPPSPARPGRRSRPRPPARARSGTSARSSRAAPAVARPRPAASSRSAGRAGPGPPGPGRPGPGSGCRAGPARRPAGPAGPPSPPSRPRNAARAARTSVPAKAYAGTPEPRRAADQRGGRLDRRLRSVGQQQPVERAGSRPGPPGRAGRAARPGPGPPASRGPARRRAARGCPARTAPRPATGPARARWRSGPPRRRRPARRPDRPAAGSGPARSRPRSAPPQRLSRAAATARAASSAASATRPVPWAASARTSSDRGSVGRPARIGQVLGPRPLAGLHRGRRESQAQIGVLVVAYELEDRLADLEGRRRSSGQDQQLDLEPGHLHRPTELRGPAQPLLRAVQTAAVQCPTGQPDQHLGRPVGLTGQRQPLGGRGVAVVAVQAQQQLGRPAVEPVPLQRQQGRPDRLADQRMRPAQTAGLGHQQTERDGPRVAGARRRVVQVGQRGHQAPGRPASPARPRRPAAGEPAGSNRTRRAATRAA